MAHEIQDVVARLTADGMPVAKELTATEKRFDAYAKHVSGVCVSVEKSLTSTLGPVGAFVGALSAKLDVAAAALTNLEAKAGGARAGLAGLGAEAKAAATGTRGVAVEAKAAGQALGSMGTQARGAGAGITSATTATRSLSQALTTASATGGRAMANLNRTITTTAARMNATVRAARSANSATRGAGAGGRGDAMGGYMLLGAGVAALGVLKEAVDYGAQFEDLLHKTYAEAGEGGKGGLAFAQLRDGVLAVAGAFDQMPVHAAEALYPIESAGFHGANALTILASASKMAKGTQTDLLDTTSLVTKTLIAYNQAVEKSGHVTDVYTRAITMSLVPGKEFVPAMANVLQVGEHAGLSVQELAGSLALLTQTSKSAMTSSTYLKNFISGLISPTKKMRDGAKELGLTWLATGHGFQEIQRVGFVKVIDEITRATHGNVSAMSALFPDMRKIQALFGLTATGANGLAKSIAGVTLSAGANDRAAKEMDSSMAQMGKHIASAWGVMEEKIKVALTPSVLLLGHALQGIIEAFNRLTPKQQANVIQAAALAAVLVTLLGVLSLAGVALGALSGGLTMVSGGFVSALGGLKNFILFLGRLPALITTLMTGMRALMSLQGIAGVIAGLRAWAVQAAITARASILAFGPGSLVLLALAGLAYEISRIVESYHTMEDAINQAAEAQGRFNDKMNALKAQGGQAAMIATRAAVTSESSDLGNAVREAKENPINVTAWQRDRQVREYLGNKGYDTNNHAYNSVEGAEARIRALDADAVKLTQAIHQAHADGVNAGTKGAHAAGADGFALALANVDPMKVPTGKFAQTCAEFVSNAFREAGMKIGTTPGARQLRDKILAMGGKAHGGAALPGDLVYYSGGRYTQGGRSGHVGYANGDGTDWESSRNRTKRGDIAGNLRWGGAGATVQFVTPPGSSFSPPGGDNSPIVNPYHGGSEPPGLRDGKAKKPKTPFDFFGKGASARSLEQMVPGFSAETASTKVLMAATTDVTTVKAKLADVDDALGRQQDALNVRLAQGKGVLRENGVALSESAVQARRNGLELAALTQKISIHLNAIKNGRAAEAAEAAKAGEAEGRYRKAFAAWQARGRAMSGRVVKPEEKQHLEEMRLAYERLGAAAKAAAEQSVKNRQMVIQESHAYAEDATHAAELLRANQRLAAEALTGQDRTRKDQYRAGTLSRSGYSDYLTGQLADPALDAGGDRAAKLTEALAKLDAVSALQKQVERDTVRLTSKTDFDQRRVDLTEQVAQMQASAKDDQRALDAIEKYRTAAGGKISADEHKDSNKNADAYQKSPEEVHAIGLAEYRAYLQKRYDEEVAADGAMSSEAASFANELFKIDEEGLKRRLEKAKEDYGAISARRRFTDAPMPFRGGPLCRLSCRLSSATTSIAIASTWAATRASVGAQVGASGSCSPRRHISASIISSMMARTPAMLIKAGFQAATAARRESVSRASSIRRSPPSRRVNLIRCVSSESTRS